MNRGVRAEKFWFLSSNPLFGLLESFFTIRTAKITSPFDDQCEAVLDAFASKWKSTCKHHDHLMTFTKQKWRKLAATERSRHTSRIAWLVQYSMHSYRNSFPALHLRLT